MMTGSSPVLPGEVRVSFPGLLEPGISCGAPSRYQVMISIAEALGVSPSQAPPSHPGHKRFRSTASALFADPGDPHPTNRAQLEALARRIAGDYYRWRMHRRDESYPGTVAHPPDGLADLLVWTYRPDGVSTRVTAVPFDAEPEELLHGLPCVEPCESSDG